MFNKTGKPQGRIDSLVGSTTRIEGNLFFSGGLRVDGVVQGNVSGLPDQPATLVISEHGRVEGDIQATHIVVSGTINGGVNASESLELQAGSRIKGDVHYKSIEMQQGAVVEGRLMHQGAEVKATELKLASGT